MTHDSNDKVRTYSGVITSGIVAVSASGLGLLIITVIGAVSEYVVPVGMTGVTVAGSLIGTVLIVGGHQMRAADRNHVELLAEMRAMEIDRVRREYAREPIVAAQVAEAVNEDVRPLVAAMHDGVIVRVQRVGDGLADLLEELRKIRSRQAHADEALVAVEVQLAELESLGERVVELERELAVALGGNVVDMETKRAFNRVNQHFQENS